MNKILLSIILTIISFNSFAQADTTKLGAYEILMDGQWVIAETGTPPISLNDPKNFDQAFIDNIKYPLQARRMGIEGRTAFTIQIDNEGNTVKTEVLYDLEADTDTALKFAMLNLPTRWIPATYNNEQVESRIVILVRFSLDNLNSVKNPEAFYKCFIRTAIPNRTRNAITIGSKTKKKKKKRKKRN